MRCAPSLLYSNIATYMLDPLKCMSLCFCVLKQRRINKIINYCPREKDLVIGRSHTDLKCIITLQICF